MTPRSRSAPGRSAKKKHRVILPAQKVSPVTLAYLQKVGPHCGGIGPAIDSAIAIIEHLTQLRRSAIGFRASGREADSLYRGTFCQTPALCIFPVTVQQQSLLDLPI